MIILRLWREDLDLIIGLTSPGLEDYVMIELYIISLLNTDNVPFLVPKARQMNITMYKALILHLSTEGFVAHEYNRIYSWGNIGYIFKFYNTHY